MRGLALAMIVAVTTMMASTACGGGGAKEVTITLDEWMVKSSAERVDPGKIKFKATNNGVEPHEFVVIKSDLPPNGLPVTDGKVDEDKVNIIGEIEPFAAGATESAEFELSAGKYLLICNIVERVPGSPVESHYQNGMVTALLVEKQ